MNDRQKEGLGREKQRGIHNKRGWRRAREVGEKNKYSGHSTSDTEFDVSFLFSLPYVIPSLVVLLLSLFFLRVYSVRLSPFQNER